MKNLTIIFLTICFTNFAMADYSSCSTYKTCNKSAILQHKLKMAIKQIQLLQKSQRQLTAQNAALCATIDHVKKTNKRIKSQNVELVKENRQLARDNTVLVNKINSLQPYSVKYQKMSQEHGLLSSQFTKACKERDFFQSQYQEACKERDLYKTKYDDICVEKDLLGSKFEKVCDEKDLYAKKYNKICKEKDLLATNYAATCAKNEHLQGQVNLWQKNCQEYKEKYDAVSNRVVNLEKKECISPQATCAPKKATHVVKFIGARKHRKTIKKLMRSLSSGHGACLEVVNTKIIPRGMEFEIKWQNQFSSAHNIFRSLAKSFAQKGIQVGLLETVDKKYH